MITSGELILSFKGYHWFKAKFMLVHALCNLLICFKVLYPNPTNGQNLVTMKSMSLNKLLVCVSRLPNLQLCIWVYVFSVSVFENM